MKKNSPYFQNETKQKISIDHIPFNLITNGKPFIKKKQSILA